MSGTKLALTVLAVAASIGAQAAVAQATSHGQQASPSFITDTLAAGGKAPLQGYRFITDTLAPGPKAPVQGYRFITDTLAPGGGTSEVAPLPSPSGFDWGDAGIGAGATAGLLLVLLGSAWLLVGRRRPVAA
jgi:hypothetical protein